VKRYPVDAVHKGVRRKLLEPVRKPSMWNGKVQFSLGRSGGRKAKAKAFKAAAEMGGERMAQSRRGTWLDQGPSGQGGLGTDAFRSRSGKKERVMQEEGKRKVLRK